MRVTVVATVFNEYGSLPGWILGLNTQTRLPDECIIVDGGSDDGTIEMLRSARLEFPHQVIAAPNANIATGRNIAIERATGDVVAVTDAGTRAEVDWLRRLVEPFEASPEVDIVAGFFAPEAGDLWTRALGASTLPDSREINRRAFLASSRSVAFRRQWFEAGFSYPEWLDYCEDVVFDLQLRGAGATQAMRTDATVRFRPRSGAVSFFKQYYRYARGDGKAGLFRERHLIRYLTYLAAAIVCARKRPAELVILAICAALYLWRPIQRYRRRYPESARSPAEFGVGVVLVGYQRAVGDVAKMAGYPVGLVWRIRRDGTARYWKSGWRSRQPNGCLPRP